MVTMTRESRIIMRLRKVKISRIRMAAEVDVHPAVRRQLQGVAQVRL